MILIDLTGKRFGRWVAISYANGRWLCQCDCGNQKSIVTASLRYGGSQSCGCLKNELAVQRYSTHRRRYTVEYSTWAGMIARCHNEESRDFEFYGKHGVIVCARWRLLHFGLDQRMAGAPHDGVAAALADVVVERLRAFHFADEGGAGFAAEDLARVNDHEPVAVNHVALFIHRADAVG